MKWLIKDISSNTSTQTCNSLVFAEICVGNKTFDFIYSILSIRIIEKTIIVRDAKMKWIRRDILPNTNQYVKSKKFGETLNCKSSNHIFKRNKIEKNPNFPFSPFFPSFPFSSILNQYPLIFYIFTWIFWILRYSSRKQLFSVISV